MARKPVRLPKRLPVGTKYVVEGGNNADGVLHVSRRYVVLPNGRTVDLPAGSPSARKLAPAAPVAPKTARDLPGRTRAQRISARAAV